MKTIETTIYEFHELSDDAKQKAIEQFRQGEYENSDVNYWVIDDCYLFEPTYAKLFKLFGEEYSKRENPVIGNNRKNIYYDTDGNSHLDCDEAIVINDERMFLAWLGIPEEMHEKVYYRIKNTSGRYPDTIIEFEPNEYDYEFTEEEDRILEDAAQNFSNHMHDVLENIKDAIDDYFRDESMIEQIEINNIEFTEDGNIY